MMLFYIIKRQWNDDVLSLICQTCPVEKETPVYYFLEPGAPDRRISKEYVNDALYFGGYKTSPDLAWFDELFFHYKFDMKHCQDKPTCRVCIAIGQAMADYALEQPCTDIMYPCRGQ